MAYFYDMGYGSKNLVNSKTRHDFPTKLCTCMLEIVFCPI